MFIIIFLKIWRGKARISQINEPASNSGDVDGIIDISCAYKNLEFAPSKQARYSRTILMALLVLQGDFILQWTSNCVRTSYNCLRYTLNSEATLENYKYIHNEPLPLNTPFILRIILMLQANT